MEYTYKVIPLQKSLPIRLVMHRKSSYSYHWHKELEIFLVLEGSIHIRTTKQHYHLEKQEMLIMNCNEIHASEYAGSNNLALIIQIDLSFCKQFGYDFTQLYFDPAHLHDKGGPNPILAELKQLTLQMILELYYQKAGYHNEVMAHIHRFISRLLRNLPYTHRHENSEALSESDFQRLNRVLKYMNDNYKHAISLKDFANEEFLNVYYLSHFFKRKVGITFSECLNQIRIQKALELLMSDKSASMMDIALSVGFPNVKSFNRTFKNKYHFTPYHYKKGQLAVENKMEPMDTEVFNPEIIRRLEEIISSHTRLINQID
ncbi:AraC family transcriptional regulator [Paenibacillus sp. UNC451MF]|uniref:AraC family transcriptional regulator n=1 Tax=Paenibacillus sp. UNC451MF TaxID=1449063 RepID=UPI00048D351B|nr:AraC family transcriptional regulator [Paenibacillus sp. UNC451MF]